MKKYRFNIGWIEGEGENAEEAFYDAIFNWSSTPQDPDKYNTQEIPESGICHICDEEVYSDSESSMTDCGELVHDDCLGAHIGGCSFCGIDV